MTKEQTLTWLINTVDRGGNMLLNVGPDRNGVIPEAHAAILREVGKIDPSQAEAESLVQDFEQSGLNRKAFCSARGVALHTLDYYRAVPRKNSICEHKRRLLTVKTGENVGQARSGMDAGV